MYLKTAVLYVYIGEGFDLVWVKRNHSVVCIENQKLDVKCIIAQNDLHTVTYRYSNIMYKFAQRIDLLHFH